MPFQFSFHERNALAFNGVRHQAGGLALGGRRFLEGCADYHETDTHIFVHANYYPDLPMDEQPVGMLRWESLRETTPSRHESGKTVIVGHTSQKGGEILDLGHLLCIDTNCHGGGWLTALDVGSGRYWQANEQGQVRAAALSGPRSAPPATIPGYQVLRCLGSGAYGSVWLADERNTGKQVAIKFYSHRRGIDWSLLNREV